MKYDAFIGGSYGSRSFLADQERTINLIPEQLEVTTATSKTVLLNSPGFRTIVEHAASPPGIDQVFAVNGRAHAEFLGREFAVFGSFFSELGRNGEILGAGDLGVNSIHDNLPATINFNGDLGGQVFITAGGNGYIGTIDRDAPFTSGLTPISALSQRAHFGAYLDGYFLALDTTSSTFLISNLAEGATWDTGSDFAQRSLAADPWTSMVVSGRGVWLFGSQTTEVWFDTGDRFPFAPTPSGVMAYGIAAPWSRAVLGDNVFWLANTKDGRICVVRAAGGYAPQIVSTYAMETKFERFGGISAAIGDAYSESGHSYYVLNFDLDGITLVYDTATGLWHERGTWIPESNEYVASRARYHAFAYEGHRWLDVSKDSLYQMSSDFVHDVDGREIRRVRRAPAILDENRRVYYADFELDVEPGQGQLQRYAAFGMFGEVSNINVTGTPGAEVTVAVDGNGITTIPIGDDGTVNIPGIPSGDTVITSILGDECGVHEETYVGAVPGWGLTSPGYRIPPVDVTVTITVTGCVDMTVTFTANGNLVPDPVPASPATVELVGGGDSLTLTPTIVGGVGPFTYEWIVWDEYGTSDFPLATSTDEIPVFAIGEVGTDSPCYGNVHLKVTDLGSGAVATYGSDLAGGATAQVVYTWNCF